MMATPLEIDVSALPAGAQRILDESGPPPLRAMAAKGVAPGLKPGEALAVVVLLTASRTETIAASASATLERLPAPLLNGALAGPLQPGVLHALAPLYSRDAAVAEKILAHAAIAPNTVATMATAASEPVAELIATNEQRLLEHPIIIEKLYLNKSTRMSTADRILELAVRNKIELTGLPAFKEAAAAIAEELIAEPTSEASFDDIVVSQALEQLAVAAGTDGEETHEVDELGQERVRSKFRSLNAVWVDLRRSQKVRLLQLGNAHEDPENPDSPELTAIGATARQLGIRDPDPLVAKTAIQSPKIQEDEIVKYTRLRNVSEEVLREIANNGNWTKSYQVKLNLVENPRCPLASAAKFIVHLRETDLRRLSRSKDVAGAIQNQIKQHLGRKTPGK